MDNIEKLIDKLMPLMPKENERPWVEVKAEIIKNRDSEIEPYDGEIVNADVEIQTERRRLHIKNMKRTQLIFKDN